jgi:hypothetical protein
MSISFTSSDKFVVDLFGACKIIETDVFRHLYTTKVIHVFWTIRIICHHGSILLQRQKVYLNKN